MWNYDVNAYFLKEIEQGKQDHSVHPSLSAGPQLWEGVAEKEEDNFFQEGEEFTKKQKKKTTKIWNI